MRLVFPDPAPAIAAVGIVTPLWEAIERIVTARGTTLGIERARDVEIAADGNTGIAGGRSPEDVAALTGQSPLRFRRLDRYASLGLTAASLALRAAREAPRSAGDPDWGILLGSSLGSWASNAEFFRDVARLPAAQGSPALFARTVSNAVNGEISIANQIGGPNQTFVSGWSAGGEALAEAAILVASGRARRVLAGGLEAPDDVLQRMHAATRRGRGMDWLPATLAEAAAVCLVVPAENARANARREPGDDAPHARLRLRAFGRVQDPAGAWSIAEALAALRPLDVATVIVANTIPGATLDRWRREAPNARFVRLVERSGEIGAAGAPCAIALAGALSPAGDRGHAGALVLTRGISGATIALALSP